jgi:hypothetical protein
MTPSELPDLAWSYPLFEALYGRRSRRFGLGFEMPEGPFRYKSAHTPVPLSEIEEALLVGAGAGFSGLALWDLPTPPPTLYLRRSGRTFPTTRPGGQTALFFTNDEALYVLDANVAASKLRAFFQGWAKSSDGTEESRLAEMRRGLAIEREQGMLWLLPSLEAALAEAEASAGETDAGLRRLDDALAELERTEQRFYEAEMHRIRAEILRKRDPADTAAVKQSLQTAIAIAQSQKARSFELRSALSWRSSIARPIATPMPTPCWRPRSRASRRPNNSPNSLRRKPCSRH